MDYNENLEGGGGEGTEMPSAPPSENSVQLSAEQFPQGMTPKVGDKLVVTAMDEDGNVTCQLEMGDKSKEGEDWEQGFKEYMRPTSEQTEAA